MKKLKFKNELNFLLLDFPHYSQNLKKASTNKIIPNFFFRNKALSIKTEKSSEANDNLFCIPSNLVKFDSDKCEEISELDEVNAESKSKYFFQDADDNSSNIDPKRISLMKNKFSNHNSLISNTVTNIPEININDQFMLDKKVSFSENNNNLTNKINCNISMKNLENNINDNENNLNSVHYNNDLSDTEIQNSDVLKSPMRKIRKGPNNYPNLRRKNKDNSVSTNMSRYATESYTNLKNKNEISNLHKHSSKEIQPFHIRIKNCIEMVENYLSKYKNFTEKFSKEIEYIQMSDIEKQDGLGMNLLKTF